MPLELINNTNLFYEETGAGEPLVLVHGAWVDHTSWDAVVPGLAEAFRVVAIDLRGHGASTLEPPDGGTVHDDIADVVALLDRLDLATANVAGISSGACVALRLAIEHPARVRRVLPHEPPCISYLFDDPENKPLLDDVGEVLTEVRMRIEAGDGEGAARQFFDDLVLLPWAEMPPETRTMIAAHALAFVGQLRDPDALAVDPDGLRTLAIPVLLSQGATSHPFSAPIVEHLVALIAHARRVVIPNAGHVPQMTNPDQYVEMVCDFIRST